LPNPFSCLDAGVSGTAAAAAAGVGSAAAHLHGPDGVGNDRPLACCDIKGNVHASQWSKDVAEQDDTIRLEGEPRLQ